MPYWKVSRLKTLMKQGPVCPQTSGVTMALSSSCQGTSDPTLLSPVMSSQRSPYSPFSSTVLAFPTSSLPCPSGLLCWLFLIPQLPYISRGGKGQGSAGLSHFSLHYSPSDLIQTSRFKCLLYVVGFSKYNLSQTSPPTSDEFPIAYMPSAFG